MRLLSDNDFSTDFGEEYVHVTTDEDSDRFYAYDHLSDEEMIEQTKKYLQLSGVEDYESWFDQHVSIEHKWVRLEHEDEYGDLRFSVLRPGEQIDEFAAPITVLQF